MNPDSKIMIIGGHGKVGQYITRELRSYSLLLAGRNEEKMKRFIKKEKLKAEVCVMDILNIDFSLMKNVGWVIVCVDQENTMLIEYCDRYGIDYMDVTANSEYIDKIQKLSLKRTSKILLGVGLAPGLTNLLAEKFIQMYPAEKNIDIQLILGLGEKHGDAAIKWTLDNFTKSYSHSIYGYLKPFTRKSKVKSGKDKFSTYNFNFVDQHMLNNKYQNKIFTTYLGFDQSFISVFLYWANKLGILRMLKHKRIYHVAEELQRNPKFGTDIFIVSIQAGEKTLYAWGHDEGRFTGLIAGEAAKRMAEITLEKGILEISNLIHVEDIADNKLFGLTLVNKEA
jgi:saccharopine dehydrogenase (NAD+, L-lysine-forming)